MYEQQHVMIDRPFTQSALMIILKISVIQARSVFGINAIVMKLKSDTSPNSIY